MIKRESTTAVLQAIIMETMEEVKQISAALRLMAEVNNVTVAYTARFATKEVTLRLLDARIDRAVMARQLGFSPHPELFHVQWIKVSKAVSAIYSIIEVTEP